jgi:ketosteroid isomerase-like protein
MSNIDTVKRMLHSLEQNDVQGWAEHLSEDVRWEFHPYGNTAQDHDVPYMRYREGRDDALGFYRDILDDFDLNSLDPHSFLHGEDKVAVVIAYELTVKSTGKRVRDEEIHLYEFDSEGRVRAFRHFLDTAKAIEAHQPDRVGASSGAGGGA